MNERSEILVDGRGRRGPGAADRGVLARRIICKVKPGDRLGAGEQLRPHPLRIAHGPADAARIERRGEGRRQGQGGASVIGRMARRVGGDVRRSRRRTVSALPAGARVRRASAAGATASRRCGAASICLPSLFTTANIFCGFTAIAMSFQREFQMAPSSSWWQLSSTVLDGRVAA